MERRTVLIVDDAEINRDLLSYVLNKEFDILQAENGEQALKIIDGRKDELSMVYLDMVMPGMNGLEVMEAMRNRGYLKFIPVIMITGEATPDIEEKAYDLGASDIIYKPFAPRVVMKRSMNIIEMFENRIHMEEQLAIRTEALRESKEKLRKSSDFLVNALSSVVEFRSLESGEHVARVKYYTGVLLKYVNQLYPDYNFSEEDLDNIKRASALHDIGKIAIPDSILLKPGKLDKYEFDEMKKHTTYGCELLENFKQEDNDFYKYCYEICRWHHERVDGRGYPDGLKGDEIPIWAQCVSIADVFDALCSKRVYKDAYAMEDAYRMILDGECGCFDERILECLKLARNEFISMATSTSVASA